MSDILFFDFETYYDGDYTLREQTIPEYVQDPRYETIMCCVQLNNEPVEVLDGDKDTRRYFSGVDPARTTTVAFNSQFDNAILSYRFGFVPSLILDTMGMARALYGHRFTRFSLAAIADVLELGEKGGYVHAMKGVHRADMNPEQFHAYAEYCKLDVILNRRLFIKLMPEFPVSERRLMDLVLRCAIQPQLYGDVPLLRGHIADVKEQKARLLTACGLEGSALRSTVRFQEALEALGVAIKTKVSPTNKTVPQFARTDPFMAELLAHADIRVQTLAAARLGIKSTIEETRAARILGVAQCMPRYALPVPLRYGGAHTHRLSGDGRLNFQNLPTARGSKGKSKLRAALVAPPGHSVVACDLGQIEARLVAWQAGCAPLLTQFRERQDPYALLATRIFARPIDRAVHIPEGFIGKTGVLGLGYSMGPPRFYEQVQAMARTLGIDLGAIAWDDSLAQKAVGAYREAYPEIPRAWWQLREHIHSSLLGNCPEGTTAQFGAVVIGKGFVRAPSGLELRYHNLTKDGDNVTFQYGREFHRLYGGKLFENITQFLARIVVMDAARRLAKQGFRFALQVHDELVYVVPDAELDVAKAAIHKEMVRPPKWAPDLPLTATIQHGPNYGSVK